MTKFIAALAVAVALSTAASAAPANDGLRMAAANGTLTPHGVWDAR